VAAIVAVKVGGTAVGAGGGVATEAQPWTAIAQVIRATMMIDHAERLVFILHHPPFKNMSAAV
jgi:sulfite reductase beta subunit-like hemoprotein